MWSIQGRTGTGSLHGDQNTPPPTLHACKQPLPVTPVMQAKNDWPRLSRWLIDPHHCDTARRMQAQEDTYPQGVGGVWSIQGRTGTGSLHGDQNTPPPTLHACKQKALHRGPAMKQEAAW